MHERNVKILNVEKKSDPMFCEQMIHLKFAVKFKPSSYYGRQFPQKNNTRHPFHIKKIHFLALAITHVSQVGKVL